MPQETPQFDFDKIIREINADREMLISSFEDTEMLLAELIKWMEVRDPDQDEPLSLVEAVCLPELGGRLLAIGEDIPSKNVFVSSMRAEIKAGRLKLVPPFLKNHLVSRRTIAEWLALRVEMEAKEQPNVVRLETRPGKKKKQETRPIAQEAVDFALQRLLAKIKSEPKKKG